MSLQLSANTAWHCLLAAKGIQGAGLSTIWHTAAELGLTASPAASYAQVGADWLQVSIPRVLGFLNNASISDFAQFTGHAV